MSKRTAALSFQSYAIEYVTVGVKGYDIGFNGGECVWAPKVEGLPDPQVGETVHVYGLGLGFTYHKVVVNGRVYLESAL